MMSLNILKQEFGVTLGGQTEFIYKCFALTENLQKKKKRKKKLKQNPSSPQHVLKHFYINHKKNWTEIQTGAVAFPLASAVITLSFR